MAEGALIQIDYRFTFAGDEVVTVDVRLDAMTLCLVSPAAVNPPAWATLASIACPDCPLPAARNAACPVAANLAALVGRFAGHYSYDPVSLSVVTAERTVTARTTLQAALCALNGLVMATSGCPILDKLRPMARFHLPLATEHETIYRAASMYLVAQYLRAQGGAQAADWSLAGLESIYGQVHEVNMAIAKRLREAAAKDASANAIVRLDLFTDGVAHSLRDRLGELAYLFRQPYLAG